MRNFEMARGEAGFTYIGLLLAVALFGVALSAVGQLWSTTLQRGRERELLFVGDEFRRAIAAYYDGTPGGGAKQFPKTLEDLLLDRRYPAVRRYLRKIYADPLTGKPEWGFVKGPGDTITGIYSLSSLTPRKHANFPDEYESFSESKRYSDWKFVYASAAVPASGTPPAQAVKPGVPSRGEFASSPLIPSASMLTPLAVMPSVPSTPVPTSPVLPGQTLPQPATSPGQTLPSNSIYQRLDIRSSAY